MCRAKNCKLAILMSRKLLPVALDVSGRACLIVGGGAVAARKAASLVECHATVTIIAPELCEALASLIEKRACKYLQRAFAAGDTSDFDLVFACTDARSVNAKIAREAKLNGAWCNLADDSAESDFHGAATIRRGEICIGISSSGGSPALSRHLKAEIEGVIGAEYAHLLRWMSEQRAEMKMLGEQKQRAELWRAILESDILSLLKAGEVESARAEFEKMVNGSSS